MIESLSEFDFTHFSKCFEKELVERYFGILDISRNETASRSKSIENLNALDFKRLNNWREKQRQNKKT
eukprot:snap_masked-scaffold_3-processed-gene-19.46-mRNA-1 protein AED:1.00 eAED:1.00 QI:0/-1/0/0/-1/1/1/0/67